MLTTTEHKDLALRLTVLVGEYAAASDRARAEARVAEAMARIPSSDLALTLEPVGMSIEEQEQLEASLEALRVEHEAAKAQAAEAADQGATRISELEATLARATDRIAELEGELEAATAPPTPAAVVDPVHEP